MVFQDLWLVKRRALGVPVRGTPPEYLALDWVVIWFIQTIALDAAKAWALEANQMERPHHPIA